MLPITVTKNLAAASSTSIGSFSSAGVVTLSCATLDTARRISVASASALGPTFTITGLNASLNQISESITTSTAVGGTPGVTTQDFIKVTGVTISCALSSGGGGLIGTNTQGGTPWQVVDATRNPPNLAFDINITSPTTVSIVSFEYTMDYPSYNQNSRLWDGSLTPSAGPRAIISSLGSSVTLDTIGSINFPITAWRITLTSTSSAAGSVSATVLQSG